MEAKYSKLNINFSVLKDIFPVKLLNNFENKFLFDNKIKVCDCIRSIQTRKELCVHSFTNVLTN